MVEEEEVELGVLVGLVEVLGGVLEAVWEKVPGLVLG